MFCPAFDWVTVARWEELLRNNVLALQTAVHHGHGTWVLVFWPFSKHCGVFSPRLFLLTCFLSISGSLLPTPFNRCRPFIQAVVCGWAWKNSWYCGSNSTLYLKLEAEISLAFLFVYLAVCSPIKSAHFTQVEVAHSKSRTFSFLWHVKCLLDCTIL